MQLYTKLNLGIVIALFAITAAALIFVYVMAVFDDTPINFWPRGGVVAPSRVEIAFCTDR